MDTTLIENGLMKTAQEHAELNRHVLGNWESFLGGAVRIATCTVCNRYAWAEILPKGHTDDNIQIYKEDIRGSAVTKECGRKVV